MAKGLQAFFVGQGGAMFAVMSIFGAAVYATNGNGTPVGFVVTGACGAALHAHKRKGTTRTENRAKYFIGPESATAPEREAYRLLYAAHVALSNLRPKTINDPQLYNSSGAANVVQSGEDFTDLSVLGSFAKAATGPSKRTAARTKRAARVAARVETVTANANDDAAENAS